MEMPISKRTRQQRKKQAQELKEKNRRARIEARKRYRREIFDVSDDDDDAVQVVNAAEYEKNMRGYEEEEPVNGVENMVIQDNLDGNYDSDASLQVIGERYNPMVVAEFEYDDVDDSDDDEEGVVMGGTGMGTGMGTGDGGGDDGSQHSSRDEIGLTSSEDDDSVEDRDFNVEEGEKYSSSEVSSSTDEEDSDDSSSGGEGFGVERVERERKKRVEGESEVEAVERRKERRRRRRRKERREQKRVRDGGEGRPRERKKRERESVSVKEVFDSLVSPGDDSGGEKRVKLGSRRSVKKIVKGSDGVFREVQEAVSYDDNMGGETGFMKSDSSHSVKVRKGSDVVYRKVVSVGENEDGNVGGETGFMKSDSSHSVKVRKGSDEVYRKVVSRGENEDGNVGGETGFAKSNTSHSVKNLKGEVVCSLRHGDDNLEIKQNGKKQKSKKGDSLSRDGDDTVDGETGSKKSDKKRYVKSKKNRKAVSSDEEDGGKDSGNDDEVPKKKAVRKEGVDEEGGESSERKVSARTLSRRKNKEKTTERQKKLLAAIFEEEKGAVEETMPMPVPREYVYLPLRFWFPAKKVDEPENSEDMEIDDLFKELEFGLQACHIGCDDTASKDIMEVDQPTSVVSGNNLCEGGNHHLVHDEEIGIYCRFCSYVMLESKHVTADFAENIFGRAGRKDAKRAESDDKNGVGSKILDDVSEQDGYEPAKVIQGTVWELIPGTWSKLYPHQREGFEFIWTNVSGGININELDRPSKYGLGGCIICHAPGTGKTRLAIVFIQSFLKQYPMSLPIIIAPRTMLRTWQEEFVRWNVEVPFFNLNDEELSGKEDSDVIRKLDNPRDKHLIRIVKLASWLKGKAILGISYGLYEKLANERPKRDGSDASDGKIREALLNKTGLLVLDEGHTPRNDKSNIWKALTKVRTMKKVILSGTPFQNNFDELSNTLSLVRKEFEVPMKAGSYVHDEKKIEEFSNRIRPFVHVHKGEILKETLKGLFATLIILNPSELQNRCFASLVGNSNFALDHCVSVASVHPSIFSEQKMKPTFIDKELSDSLDSHKEDLDAGVKTRFLFELIKLCNGERVLVFGQYLPPLNFLAGLMKTRFNWEMGRELLYMDGKQDTKERQNTIRLFNDTNSEARVLLASTKACSEGIHLVGASRVVLLDVVWNPSVERQAISRAYRLGQKKDVFVYHLITSGTLEEQKYRRQADKERMSELVFSSKDGKFNQKSMSKSRDFKDQVLEAMYSHEKLNAMFHKVVYQPKADNLIESFGPLNL